MISLLSTVQNDEDRDTEKKKSPYVTKRELTIVPIVFIIIVIVLYFTVYQTWKADRDAHVSKTNLKGIYAALKLYSEQNDEGFPPSLLFSEGKPITDSLGNPICWANAVTNFLTSEASLTNPASQEDWDSRITVTNQQGERESTRLSYGLVTDRSLMRWYYLDNDKAIVAETISSGKANSINPMPIERLQDGFLIGFNDSNFKMTPNSNYVTRVAFTSEKPNPELNQLIPLHKERGTFVLTAAGGIISLTNGEELSIKRTGKIAKGIWSID